MMRNWQIAVLLWGIVSTTLGQSFPPRPIDALRGSELVAPLTALARDAREVRVEQEVLRGNIPSVLRTFVPLTSSAMIDGISRTVRYYVAQDYLSVGDDSDFFLMPLSPLAAQRIANALHCVLPTKKMVDQIWAAAPMHLPPQPIPPSAAMITVPVFNQHNDSVKAIRSQRYGPTRTGLIAGHKKDVIISTKIYTGLKANVPKPVVIYGWQYLSGSVIQSVYNGHEETYADYSHGIRLVADTCRLDGELTTIATVLASSDVNVLLSDEGVIMKPYYTVPTDVEETSTDRPQGHLLMPNYPNPFNPSTMLPVVTDEAGLLTVKVFDLLGREIATLLREERPAGMYSVPFHAGTISGGCYVATVQLEETTSGLTRFDSRRMIFLK